MGRSECVLASFLQLFCALTLSQEGNSVRSSYYAKVATEYTVVDVGNSSKQSESAKYNLVGQPLMVWTSLQDYDGGVFAWTHNGKPVVVASLFSGPGRGESQRTVYHEFVSFAEQPLSIARPTGNAWSPEPLTEWTRLPDSPTVGKTQSQLKLQARNLAKNFTASLNRLGETWELRLLPKPLYEYGSLDQSTKCGALFAFVAFSTDPEILLILEARDTPEGTHWVYAIGRSSNKSLYLDYRGESLWKSPRRGHGSTDPDQEDPRYRVLHVGSEDASKMLKQP